MECFLMSWFELSLLSFAPNSVFSIVFARATVRCSHAQWRWLLRNIEIVDRIELLDGLCETNEENSTIRTYVDAV